MTTEQADRQMEIAARARIRDLAANWQGESGREGEMSMAETVMEWANCRDVEIDADEGGIWIATPQAGQWLGLNEIMAYLDWLDRTYA
jgi:hypothetical protein